MALYVLNAEKPPCRSELAREFHGERQAPILGAVRTNREQARSYRCSWVPVNCCSRRSLDGAKLAKRNPGSSPGCIQRDTLTLLSSYAS